MEQSGISEVIAIQNSEAIKQAEGLDRKFYDSFAGVFADAVDISSRHIPTRPQTETIQIEGTFGVLPSPAKKIVVKEVLSGHPTPPLKVSEETIETDKQERPIDTATLHAVIEVTPKTSADREEVRLTVGMLSAIQKLLELGKKPSGLQMEIGDLLITIKNTRAVLHLIRRGVLGNYRVENLALVTSTDFQRALSEFEKMTFEALQFNPQEKSNSDTVAHEVINQQIAEDIARDKGPAKVSLAVLAFPKDFETLDTKQRFQLEGDRFYYRRTTYPLIWDALPHEDPFIRVSKEGAEVRVWNQ